MTEEQKYQGALYKNKKAKTNSNTSNTTAATTTNMAQRAYVEDVPDCEGWEDVRDPPPRVPTPPKPDDIDVFKYMVNATPTASTTALPADVGPSEAEPSEGTQLVRFEEPKNFDDLDLEMMADDEALISYGSGPIPAGLTFDTPLPIARERRRSEKSVKKDKKRKRLHVDTHHDLEMTDAPGLHSGLTDGLSRMMSRPQTFPPSPDYSGSGGEFGETPASPLKKSKHSKHHRSSRPVSGIGNNLFSMLTSGGTSTGKASKRKSMPSTTAASSKKRHSHQRAKRLEGAKEPKMIEYKGESSHERDGRSGAGAVVVVGRRADVFFSQVNKGPESERGCSVNKVLKRFHRVRSGAGDSLPKSMEEKELFKSLRMRRNDRGEIVLFSI